MSAYPWSAQLQDGRSLHVAEATGADLEAIAQAHPLPRDLTAPEAPLRAYYRLKAWLYMTSRPSGIVVGRVDGVLAGFVCYCGDTAELSRLTRSPRAVLRGLGWLLTGRMGGPRLWIAFARWARQHFRTAAEQERTPTEEAAGRGPLPAAWIDTVETVPAFRRLGVADQLLEAATSSLRAQGRGPIGSWVAEDNVASLALFEKQGFRRAERVQRLGECCWLMLAEPEALAGEWS
jgi:ribosomal protein S18 acetylase RimI-like enzyme